MFCCHPDFFQNTIFDLTPVFAFAVGPFSGIFLEHVFFKIRAGVKYPVFACVLWYPGAFSQNTMFDLTPVVAVAVGSCSGASVKNACSKFGPMRNDHVFACACVVSCIVFRPRFHDVATIVAISHFPRLMWTTCVPTIGQMRQRPECGRDWVYPEVVLHITVFGVIPMCLRSSSVSVPRLFGKRGYNIQADINTSTRYRWYYSVRRTRVD